MMGISVSTRAVFHLTEMQLLVSSIRSGKNKYKLQIIVVNFDLLPCVHV